MENAKKERVGLIVVHGIGEQKEGQTRESVVEGLRFAYPQAQFRTDGKAVVVEGFDRDIRIYEVHWAKVLSGPAVWKSFKIEHLQETVWFPYLNHRHLQDYAKIYPRALVALWTLALVPLGAVLTAAYWGLNFVAGSFGETFLGKRFKVKDKDGRTRNRFEMLLDEVAADVSNYVNAAGGAPAPVPNAADQIYEKFRATLEEAVVTDGCREIQILAHSLGTVVAYHALTRYAYKTGELIKLSESGADDRPRLSRLYTIGSPLEKMQFFWPKLIGSRLKPDEESEGFSWDNFANKGDPVAGVLRRYDKLSHVSNHTVSGAGGLITAHTSYRTHPRFLSVFGLGLTGVPTEPKRNLLVGWLRGLAEGLAVPAALVAASFFGIFFLYAMGYFVGTVFGMPLQELGEFANWGVLETAGRRIRGFFNWTFVVMLVGLAIPLGWWRARKAHAEHWQH